jgi:hypothetical protein
MTDHLSEYPEFDILAAFINRHGLTIYAGSARPSIGTLDGIVVEITAPDQPRIQLTVFDEYSDTRRENPLLFLVLIAMEFGELEDAMSVEDWARAQGLDIAAETTRPLYANNMRAKSAFLELYGPVPEVVSDLDWQLNAGVARALRAMKA